MIHFKKKITHISSPEFDNQKIYKFIDLNGLRKAIGMNNIVSLSFNFLSSYRKHEDSSRKDNMEGITTCNDALISCWTYFEIENQIEKKQFCENYVIISNVQKLRELTCQIYKNKNYWFGVNRDYSFFLNAICGYVSYYPEVVEKLPGVDSETIRSIFIKRHSFRNQHEFRFAIIINFLNHLSFLEQAKVIKKKELLIFPEMPLINGHYINEIISFGEDAYENLLNDKSKILDQFKIKVVLKKRD